MVLSIENVEHALLYEGSPPISLTKAQFCQYKILVEIENCRLQS